MKVYKLCISDTPMQVSTPKGYEELGEVVEAELQKVLDERAELGLSVPEDFSVGLNFYYSQKAFASAFYASPPGICLNILPMVQRVLKREDAEKIITINQYFDTLRDLLGEKSGEEHIVQLLEHPVRTIKMFEKRLGANFDAYKHAFEANGTPYKEYRRAAVRNAKCIRMLLDGLKPVLLDSFPKVDFSSLRHEMDHVDLFSSPMYARFISMEKRAYDLLRKWQFIQSPAVSKEYAKAHLEKLAVASEVLTLMEIRALFFNSIAPSGWKHADFEKVKKKVYGEFADGYVEGEYPEKILDAIVCNAWSHGKMDKMTSNYLFEIVNRQRGSINQMRYVVKLDEVNYDVASQILYIELPLWKARFAANGLAAVEAVGNAYRDDPKRLAAANKAETFKEFLRVCGG